MYIAAPEEARNNGYNFCQSYHLKAGKGKCARQTLFENCLGTNGGPVSPDQWISLLMQRAAVIGLPKIPVFLEDQGENVNISFFFKHPSDFAVFRAAIESQNSKDNLGIVYTPKNPKALDAYQDAILDLCEELKIKALVKINDGKVELGFQSLGDFASYASRQDEVHCEVDLKLNEAFGKVVQYPRYFSHPTATHNYVSAIERSCKL